MGSAGSTNEPHLYVVLLYQAGSGRSVLIWQTIFFFWPGHRKCRWAFGLTLTHTNDAKIQRSSDAAINRSTDPLIHSLLMTAAILSVSWALRQRSIKIVLFYNLITGSRTDISLSFYTMVSETDTPPLQTKKKTHTNRHLFDIQTLILWNCGVLYSFVLMNEK